MGAGGGLFGHFSLVYHFPFLSPGGGRVVRRCWVNFQCRGVLLIWIRVGQGPPALAGGAGGGCVDIFSLVYHCSFLSPSLWGTARYRLKYCLKGPLSPKQPTKFSFSLSLGDGPISTEILSQRTVKPPPPPPPKKKKKKKKKKNPTTYLFR